MIFPTVRARSSNDASLSSIEQGPTGDLGIPLLELEGHLSGEKCLDIFTMKPRVISYPVPHMSTGFADLCTASAPSDLATHITLRENNENRCRGRHPLRPSLDGC